jgi:predicted TIM-barrel fold metal-dependent hydrolase
MSLDTLADYEALLEKICRWSVEEKGVKAFKNTEMYFRRLDYKLRSYEEAALCYKPNRTAEEETILSDYIACIVFRMAGKLNVPVQIHTGSIWGDFNMSNISPEHLATVLTAFPNTKFDLLHGGDPFYGTMALMGSAFSNVYVNMSTMPNTSYDDFKHWLSIFLDRVPSSKISLGWDEFAPEMVVGDAVYTRDVVAAVLAEKIDNGLYSYDLALEIAHDIMHRTAETLFRIP